MYLHLGGSYTISDKWVIGIFDLDATTEAGSATIDFLKTAERDNRLEAITAELPRSFVVTLDKVYLSPIAAATLRKRLEQATEPEHNNPTGR